MLKVQVESLQIGVWIFADVLDSFASFAPFKQRGSDLLFKRSN
jgi:hypothetical protein